MRVIEEIPACLSMMLLRSPNGRIQNEDDREKASPKMEGGFLRELRVSFAISRNQMQEWILFPITSKQENQMTALLESPH